MVEAHTKKTFTLEVPTEHEGETVTTLALRRPKGREVRRMQNATGNAGDVSFELMANLSERPEGLFDEMDASDVLKIEAWLNSLLGN